MISKALALTPWLSVIAFLAAGITSTPATAQPADPSSSLTDAIWLAEDILGRGVIDNAQSTIRIGADNQASGSGGCNRIKGTAAISGNELTFGPMAGTRMMCPEALMDQERKFLAALEATRSYKFEGPYLKFYDESGAELIRFTRLE